MRHHVVVGQAKVFLSHTKEFFEFPQEGLTFVQSAIRAVRAVGCDWEEMNEFTADSRAAEELCRSKVRACSIWVGIIGFRYGSICQAVDQSFTELEFGAALHLERLAFLYDGNSNLIPHRSKIGDPTDYSRQTEFRERVEDEVVCNYFSSPDQLQNQVESALRPIVAALQGPLRPDWFEAIEVEETRALPPQTIDLAFRSEQALTGVPEACWRLVRLVGHLERRAQQPEAIAEWPPSDQIAVARRGSLSMEPMTDRLSSVVLDIEAVLADSDSLVAHALAEGSDYVRRAVQEIDDQLTMGSNRLNSLLAELRSRPSREWVPIAAQIKDISDRLVALIDVSSTWRPGRPRV